MKIRNLMRIPNAVALSIIACATAQAAVITDFSTFSQPALLNLIGNPPITGSTNTRPQTFTNTTGVGVNTVVSTAGATGGGAGQSVYLSDAFSLATVGSRISAGFSGAATFGGTSNNSQAIGLVVASAETNTARTNMVTWVLRRNANLELGYTSFDGTSTGTTTATTNLGTGATITFPDELFIERTAGGYILGSITAGISTTHHTLTIGMGGVTADGTAIGVFSDVRAANNVNTLSNLTYIPEPGAALLGSLGMLALLRRRR